MFYKAPWKPQENVFKEMHIRRLVSYAVLSR